MGLTLTRGETERTMDIKAFKLDLQRREDGTFKLPPCLELLKFFEECKSRSRHQQYIYNGTSQEKTDKEWEKSCEIVDQGYHSCVNFTRAVTKEAKDKHRTELNKFLQEIDQRQRCTPNPSSAVWKFRENPAADWFKTTSDEIEDKKRKLESSEEDGLEPIQTTAG